MAGSEQTAAERLATLKRDIQELQTATEKPRPVKPPPPPKRTLSPGEKIARRVLLWTTFGWAAFIYVLIVASSPDMPLWEMVAGGALTAGCALGIYGFQLFYWELGKSTWRWVSGNRSARD